MALFDIPLRGGRESDIAIAKKSNAKQKSATPTIKGGTLATISNAKLIVEEKLGHLKDDYLIIRDKQSLDDYLTVALNISKKLNQPFEIAIDTETTGLDPIKDKIVGLCLYAPGVKASYIPINHVSYITGERVDRQLTEEEINESLEFLKVNNARVIMFNAPFDIRVLRNQCGVYLNCYWDCYLGARCLNENEPVNGLKHLHKKYVLKDKDDAFSFGELFKGLTFDKVPIDTAYIYAAHDAIITYELYKFQEPFLDLNQEREDLKRVSWVFRNIEMPIVDVVSNMEDIGVDFDTKYNQELSDKYNKILEEKTELFYKELSAYDGLLSDYKKSHPDSKIETKLNIASPTQLAELFYDVLKIDVIDPKTPRGTGVEIMKKIDLPIAKAILDYRETSKLITTYIDKLPTCVNKDGRIHCKFNQYGADTGRFSSNDPNLQNIPSHNKDIRKMFKATDGYILMSSDFSQQEPKCLAALCRQQGDSQMYDTFMQGKDLYSEIASKAFHKPYEECCEFAPDGSKNPKEYKERRTQAKSILLGVLYGRGTASVAEQLKCSVEEAEDIKESVFKGFPAIRKFEQDSLEMARTEGYVTTVCGRKRRLYDMQLPEYEFEWRGEDTDPLNFDTSSKEVPMYLVQKYWDKLQTCRFGQKRKVFEEANKENVWIIDNGKKIADATRQCVNARIQGSAADLTKIAMIELNTNERLKELGFRMLIPVHDEIIAECPKENARECADLLAQTMSKAAERILEMPIKCDVEVTEQWYGEEYKI